MKAQEPNWSAGIEPWEVEGFPDYPSETVRLYEKQTLNTDTDQNKDSTQGSLTLGIEGFIFFGFIVLVCVWVIVDVQTTGS